MAKDVVIQAEKVSKEYRLGVINHGTLYRDLQSWWAKVKGRPDPNAEISDLAQDASHTQRVFGDHFKALEDISFEVAQGDVIGLIGKNGAGKSTLLKVISRITAPTSGQIRLRGRVASLLEVGTGFHPELTGKENVFLNGAILGMAQKEIRNKFDQIVEFAEIGEFVNTPVKRYSSGMYVRLAFSVAAHLEPEILLVDEVLAVGDANFQKKCMGRMKEVSQEGRTILFVSHNMTAINSICKEAIHIHDGRLVDQGETSAVIQRYLDSGQVGTNGVYSKNPEELKGKAVIFRVAVLDHTGKESGTLELNQGFSVEVCYELREALSGLSVGLQVLGEDGYTAIYSLPDPELEPSRLETRKAGRYRGVVKFPPCALNTGAFYIRAGISSSAAIYSVVEGLRIEVHDSVGIIQMVGQSRKNSISALQLPWQVETI